MPAPAGPKILNRSSTTTPATPAKAAAPKVLVKAAAKEVPGSASAASAAKGAAAAFGEFLEWNGPCFLPLSCLYSFSSNGGADRRP